MEMLLDLSSEKINLPIYITAAMEGMNSGADVLIINWELAHLGCTCEVGSS